jgi:aldose 1-epimerase
MAFTARTQTRPDVATGLDPTVHVLEDGAGARAEVWPALGFNCYSWQVEVDGQPLRLLYADPALFNNGRPTRSGIPVLFPFPNRIRAGRFRWGGKDYQLPLNDPAQKNAIHGFACRRPWRVLDQGADATGAWVTGAFRCSQDDPASRALWPADHEIRLTYRLGEGLLRLEAEVSSPEGEALPFGLGYHPYFRLPFTGDGPADSCLLNVPARSYWVLQENLPTGEKRHVDGPRDLNVVRPFGEITVDDVLTALPDEPPGADGLIERGAIDGGGQTRLHVRCSPDFREVVVFTPPHRQAFCIEPYTCTTDAINLQQRGLDAGWRELPPGRSWSAVVELRI